MRTRTYVCALLLSLCAAAAAAHGQRPSTAYLTTEEPGHSSTGDVSACLVVFSVAPDTDDFAPLFAGGKSTVTITTRDFKRLAASEVARRHVRPDARMMTAATLGVPATLTDDPAAETPSRTMRVRLSRPAGPDAPYEVSLDASGPTGSLRSTFTVGPDETILFALPGNFFAATRDASRKTYAAFTATPARQSWDSLAAVAQGRKGRR